MKIDSSRYSMFWNSPERFRLRQLWKLSPIEPAPGTFKSMLTYGRRRGSCFHDLMDGRHRQVDPIQSVQELRDGGFGNKEIAAAVRMSAAVKSPAETLQHEALFEYPIPGSPHIMTGRVDSIIREYDEELVMDYKTSKHRSKTDASFKLDTYCRGPQVPFYLLGSRALGYDTKGFIYRLVMDSPKGVHIIDRRTERTGLELAAFAHSVHQTCELILFMQSKFGIQNPWVNLPSAFDSDYAAIVGRKAYVGYLPDGFYYKPDHLSLEETNA